MIVSHKYRFVFIKTAKTAGTSLTIFLAHFCGTRDLVTQLKKNEIEYAKSLGYQIPQGFFTNIESIKLSVWKLLKSMQSDHKVKKTSGRKVRKNLSAYAAKMYLGQEVWNNYFKFCFERNPYDKAISLYFWHTRNFEKCPDINEYIQRMSQSQLSNWHVYTINDQVAVDFVGKYEKLDEDLRIVTNKLGLPDYALPKAKGHSRTSHQHYSKLLDKESRHHIEKMCANEIETFKYGWESSE